MLTSYWKVIKISCHLQTSQLLLLCEVCNLQKIQFGFVCYLPLSDIRDTYIYILVKLKPYLSYVCTSHCLVTPQYIAFIIAYC